MLAERSDKSGYQPRIPMPISRTKSSVMIHGIQHSHYVQSNIHEYQTVMMPVPPITPSTMVSPSTGLKKVLASSKRGSSAKFSKGRKINVSKITKSSYPNSLMGSVDNKLAPYESIDSAVLKSLQRKEYTTKTKKPASNVSIMPRLGLH